METKDLIAIDYTDKSVINTLKQTVAIGATDAEFGMFTQFCQSTGLNPFKKEIWFIKAGGRVQLMTGINGFLAIANSHPQYDGLEIDIEVDQNGNPLKAVCKVYRKDRSRPSIGIALMKEFMKPTPIWKQMPSVMLTKVAKSIALREAFPQELNGMYTQEEMPPEYSLTDKVEPGAVIVADALPAPEASQSEAMPEGVTPMDIVKAREWENVKNTWSGQAIVNFGKHKGKTWAELSAEYVEWLFHNTKGDLATQAGFEIHRREQVEQEMFEEINNQAAKVSEDFDNDPLPEFNNKGA